MAYKVFTNGSVLNASEINENLMNQAVMVFTNSTARSAALTSPSAGMVTYLSGTNVYESYNGTSWVTFGGPAVILVDYLVIAGGGGGGQGIGGGGGAGGYQTSVGTTGGGGTTLPSLILYKSTNYPVRVGAGGAGGTGIYNNTATTGGNGSPSQFILYSVGGGGGGIWTAQSNGKPGASGGGNAYAGVAGTGTFGQGFDGGFRNTAGGGGGGASAAATNHNGAAGISSDITGTSITRGGGGGGGYSPDTGNSGTGGSGGGGAGGASGQFGASGTVNTGGGGGGSANGLTGTTGSGGSGLVVLRYPSALTITIGAGLTGSTSTVGANKVTTITAGAGNVSWA